MSVDTDMEVDHFYHIDLSKPRPWHYDGPTDGLVDIGNGFVLSFDMEDPTDVGAFGDEPEYRMHVTLIHNGKEISSDYQAVFPDEDLDEDAAFRDAVIEVLSVSWGEMKDLAGIKD